jgi:AcrR family transcriptional regulator
MNEAAAHYHHGNLRSALLDAAARKIETDGVDRLSLRELARELGVSHGAPARHFADRHALLDALAARGREQLGDELAEAMAQPADGFEAGLAAFARGYVSFAAAHPALAVLALTRRDADAAARPEPVAAAERTFGRAQRLVADAQASGEIVGDDPDRVALAVLALVHGLATMVANDMAGPGDPGYLITGTVQTLVSGLLPRE